MDYLHRLEDIGNANSRHISNADDILLYLRYMYYTLVANRMNRLRFFGHLGTKITPFIAVLIKHIFDVEEEKVELNFNDAELEKKIYNSMRINPL